MWGLIILKISAFTIHDDVFGKAYTRDWFHKNQNRWDEWEAAVYKNNLLKKHPEELKRW